MKNSGKVSVIMPVYGVEAYLPKCLQSVCNQTYKDLEILIIDDESPDNSGRIADEFASKDNRIKVFHIKNRGAAGARNVGLDNCTGDYVFFVDTDDWLEDNAIEIMLNCLYDKKVDIVQCQYIDEFTNKSEKHICNSEFEFCDDAVFIGEMIPHWEYILIWNKLYKAELFSNVRFVEGRCIDDEFFTYKVIANSKKIWLMNEYLYHYRLRKSSAMGNEKKYKQRLVDQVDFVTQRYSFLVNNYPNLQICLLEHMLEVLMSVMRNGFFDKSVYKYAKKKLFVYGKKALCNKNISKSIKKSVTSYLLGNRKRFTSDNKNDNNKYYFD